MLKYSEDCLKDLADRIQNGEHPPIPIYDSNDPETRKEIGVVMNVWYENGELKYSGELHHDK